jgi:hypothetical protein
MDVPIKQLQKTLLSNVGARLQDYGFKLKSGSQSFRQNRTDGWNSFHLAFIPHQNMDFDVTADVAIRHDLIEECVNDGNTLISKADRVQTATIGVEIGNLTVGSQVRWKVATEGDLQGVAASVGTAFESVALPYYRRYRDLEKLAEILSSNEPDGWMHCPIHVVRCMRAVAAKFLLGAQDQMEVLIQRNEEFLRSRHDPGLVRFTNFVDRIRQIDTR